VGYYWDSFWQSRCYHFGIFAGISSMLVSLLLEVSVIIKLAMMFCYFLCFLNVLKYSYFYCYAELVATATTSSVASFDRKVTNALLLSWHWQGPRPDLGYHARLCISRLGLA